jgi:hypothetical protein
MQLIVVHKAKQEAQPETYYSDAIRKFVKICKTVTFNVSLALVVQNFILKSS